jgi:curli biogenesis system outer membrane secretion channel CsgG
MKARQILAAFMAMACATSLMLPNPAMASAKRRVAILPFEYGAVSSEVGTVDVGKGITSLLITKLVEDGTYSVVERQVLDSMLKEQNLSVSDRADPSTACKIGKLLSVDAIIVGTVTQFGFETKNMNIGGAASVATGFIPYGGGFGLGSLGSHKSKVRVAVDARLCDINTSEILGVAHGIGESKRSGMSLWGGGGGGWSGGGGGFDFGSSGFASSIAGEATMQAVDSMGSELVALAAKIPDNQSVAAASVTGKVADVQGTQVTVNVGKNNGLKSGDSIQIERAYKQILDPDTGKVLKELSNTIAVVTLNDVDASVSTGNIIKGSGVRVGDTIRKVTTDVSAVIVNAPMGVVDTGTTLVKKSLTVIKSTIPSDKKPSPFAPTTGK